MEQNDFLHGNSDENQSLSDSEDLDVEKRNKKVTLRVMNNRNPSAILDPETVRAGKVQERKIKIIVIFISIMFPVLTILIGGCMCCSRTDNPLCQLCFRDMVNKD